jgi:hypothetical protein
MLLDAPVRPERRLESVMARVFIIDDEFGKLAKAYYDRFPQEPVTGGFLAVDAATIVKSMSISNLLAGLDGLKAGSDAVIVSHGNSNGMLMPLTPGAKVRGERSTLATLLDAGSNAEAAKSLKLAVKDVDAVMTARDKVVKLGLKHVAFRGCRIADNEANLTRLRDFLGAGGVSATKMLSTYGWARTEVMKAKEFQPFWNSPKSHKFEGPVRGVFIATPGKNHTEVTRLIFDGPGGLLPWIRENLYAATDEATAKAIAAHVPLHWLSNQPPVLPLDGTHKRAEVGYADYMFDA